MSAPHIRPAKPLSKCADEGIDSRGDKMVRVLPGVGGFVITADERANQEMTTYYSINVVLYFTNCSEQVAVSR